MINIISKRHPIKFYLYLIIGVIFVFGFGTLLLIMGIDIIQSERQLTLKDYFMPVSGIALYFLTFYMIFSYWKNSPKILIDNHQIQIGPDIFKLTDIKDIIFTGKMQFKFLITHPMEGMAILFNDNTEKILFDDMYHNSSEIKLYLEHVVLKNEYYHFNIQNDISKEAIRHENEEIFKGNQFTSFRGISLWGSIIFLSFITFGKGQFPSLGLLFFFGGFVTFWFVLFSWLMHYFGLTKNYLVVRNHNFIWKVNIFLLTDIKEVVFETQGKQPNCLRIIKKDFKNEFYPAGTLRDKTWLELKRKLESRGVPVRNECIYEE